MNRRPPFLDRDTLLTIAQLNLQNSKAVGDEARQILVARGVDVLMAQEPYSIGGSVGCFGLTSSFLIAGNSAGNERPMSALVCKPERAPIEMLDLKTQHFSTAEFNTRMGKLYIVSGYFQFQDQIEPYLDHLGLILERLRGKHVLIGIDANARSQLWHADVTDDRGLELEVLIETYGLIVLNEPGQPATHTTGNNIDVTLATPGLARRIRDWKVHEVESSSDHRLITMTLTTGGQVQTFEKDPSFLVSKMDPERIQLMEKQKEK